MYKCTWEESRVLSLIKSNMFDSTSSLIHVPHLPRIAATKVKCGSFHVLSFLVSEHLQTYVEKYRDLAELWVIKY